MVWLLFSSAIFVTQVIAAAQLREPHVRSPIQSLAVFGVSSNHTDIIPTVTHDKDPGSGYTFGSPLYGQQESSDKPTNIKYKSAKVRRVRRQEKRMKATRAEKESSTAPFDPFYTPKYQSPQPTGPQVQMDSTRPSVHDPAAGPAGSKEVSTALWCVICLACQYFAVYSMLMVVRAVQGNNTAYGEQPSMLAMALESAATTVNYAPMLCILYLAARMRAIQLTQGETEKYGLPQSWVRAAMMTCTCAVLAQLVVVFLVPLFTGSRPVTDADGNIDYTRVDNPKWAWMFLFLRFATMLGLYGGYATVCVGIYLMEAPAGVYPEGTPPVSPAVSCVINLTTQYFIVYLLLALFRTYNHWMGYAHTRASDVMQLAAYTVNFAPMLCILFVGARMRALQIDPVRGNPQPWAQTCFYMCTYSVLVQTILVICVPFFLGGRCHKGTSEGDITFEFARNKNLGLFLECIRWMAMICMYGGFSAVIVSVLIIQNEAHPERTPPVSPAMQCIIHLTIQFFAVNLCLWLVISLRQWGVTDTASEEDMYFSATTYTPMEVLQTATTTVMFCPMLCILFLAARMRALQLTRNRGAPQGWAQDSMRFATWCVLGQLLCVLTQFFPGCNNRPSRYDQEDPLDTLRGERKTAFDGTSFKGVVEFLRFFFMIGMYFGAILVIAAIFMMTPATANGTGSWLFGRDAQTPYL